jgi:defect-in-organelle-trafficking protein DotC
MPKHNTLVVTILACALLASCAGRNRGKIGSTSTLQGLQAMAFASPKKGISQEQKNKMRIMGIKETALSIGAQSGLAYRAKKINSYLVLHNQDLDKVYNFNALVLENNVLPPVLLEGRNTFNLDTPNGIRISDRTYKIAKQARFITTPPNWRQYIWMDYKLPARPHSSILPKTKEERAAWQFYVTQGWQKGQEQADVIFADNLARLKLDYTGMIQYRKLLAQNMVSPPYVSHTDLGVTGDGNEIHIDDRALRITALPALKPDSRQWHAAISKATDALKNLRNREKLVNTTKIEISDKAWQPVIPKT